MSSPFNRHQRITAERLWDKNPSGIISFNVHRLIWFSRPNPWKLTVGCFLLCLNNIHLQDRWHIRRYISLHDCHYNLEFLALGECTNEERLCVPFFQYIPCYTEVAKQLLYYSVMQSCSLLACPWWKKRRKRLGLSFPDILVCIQDCMLLSWSEIK